MREGDQRTNSSAETAEEGNGTQIKEEKTNGQQVGPMDTLMGLVTRKNQMCEQVEETIHRQGGGTPASMDTGTMMQAMKEENSVLTMNTTRALERVGRTQIAMREGTSWGLVMITMTGSNTAVHVWVPEKGIRGRDELVDVVDTWVRWRAYELGWEYQGMTAHSTPREWRAMELDEQVVKVAEGWARWHNDGKPGPFHLGGVYYPVEGKDDLGEQGDTGLRESTRDELRKGVREYVQMVTMDSKKKPGETILVCGDLNATTGAPKNRRDKEWREVADSEQLDFGM
ncbi:hypothetical protein CYMTET_42807 [Cymbomonas tetramitiformis]|uniref:Endonuclease/exonuclease/phosphatase domain-containing protein n=1 Tax=Cymbomonas tetramitiformis TaxID=36881 RepID=A0AAE0C4T1_9CHLO|nr:hypothetical protein CYMTET_42807 [Cymbomonas tetramitiformis]